MTLSPTEAYAASLRDRAEWSVRSRDGRRAPLPVDRWRGALLSGDEALLRCCTGPTVDAGCGPGRLTEALAARGVPALGVDLTGEAVQQTVARGAIALRRSVFARLPGEGRWSHVLLADGNIGIGGDPLRLLRRARDLVRAGGTVVCELSPGRTVRTFELALESPDGVSSAWFPWARVGIGGLGPLAALAGLCLDRAWREERRWFAVLRR